MEIHNDIFNKIISLENLFVSWEEFKVGKTKKADVLEFERHLEDNIFSLNRELKNKTYKHSNYTSFYITDPKLRHINKAKVKDRIVHHAIHRILYIIFDPIFIHDSYSCRIEKGTHRAVARLESFTRKVSKNYTEKCFILKCDIKKYFASVDHEILLGLLEKKIADQDIMKLIREIVGSFEAQIEREYFDYAQHKSKKGIPLGNLTSQLFANVYLNEFDQFMKHHCKVRPYIRYCDDFVIVSDDEEYLQELLGKIDLFLKTKLQLTLHPNKIEIRKLTQGIDFLGYVVLPYYKVLRTKTKRRMVGRVNEENVSSYLGLLKHCEGYEVEKKVRVLIGGATSK